MKKIILLIVCFTLVFGVSWSQPLAEMVKKMWPEKEVKFNSGQKLLLPLAVDHTLDMPPAQNQGDQGSCAAFAVAYFKAWQEGREKGWDLNNPNNQFSPAFIYNSTKGSYGPGVLVGTALEFVCQHGCANLTEMPYNQYDDTTRPTLSVRYSALEHRSQEWRMTFNVLQAKNWLVNSPIIGVIINPTGSQHVVCIVGYNDTLLINGQRGGFKYLNSVGSNWGDNGFGWLEYARFDSVWFFMTDRETVKPELVFRIKSNLWSDCTYFLDSVYEIMHFSFVDGDDTLKQINIVPDLEDWLLVLDETEEVSGAKDLIISGEYQYFAYWNKPWPLIMEVKSVSTIDSWGNETILKVVSNRTDSILDSIMLGQNIRRNYYSKFTAKANLAYPIGQEENKESEISTLQVYPNPVTDQAVVHFLLGKTTTIFLMIYDLTGRLIEKTFLGNLSPGEHRFVWTNNLPVGMYLFKLQIGTRIETKKVFVVR